MFLSHGTIFPSGSVALVTRPALRQCNRCSCIGPRVSGGPAPYGGWAGYSCLPDAPCAREL